MVKHRNIAKLIVVVALASSCAMGAADTDACGDPLPDQHMRDDPQKIIDYLRQQPDNQRVEQLLDNHPFIQNVEAGKLDKDQMTNFVANYAYHLERVVRVFGGGFDRFGSAFPVMERRDFMELGVDMHREYLRRLQPLADAFGINDISSLMKIEPNPKVLVRSSHMTEIVAHARDLSELVAALVVRMDQDNKMHTRIQKALRDNAQYKTWNLGDKELHFFDSASDSNDIERLANPILRQAVDEKIVICHLRRRLNQINNGVINFWDGMNEGRAPRDDGGRF